MGRELTDDDMSDTLELRKSSMMTAGVSCPSIFLTVLTPSLPLTAVDFFLTAMSIFLNRRFFLTNRRFFWTDFKST